MRAGAAALCGAFALGAAAQEATRLRQAEVGLERATRVPQEIVWLRDEVRAEIWRQNPDLGQALRSCATTTITKEACAVGARPPSRHAFGAASYVDARPVGGGVFLMHADVDQGARARAYPTGEGNGGEALLYGLPPVAAPRMAVAYVGTIKLQTRELPVTIAEAPAAVGANPGAARLRAEVEAEIERDRARLVAATQQSCDSPASIRQGCTVKPPRRFAFAG